MSDRKQSFLETYEIREQLGAGSGGTVIKAYHKNLQKEVVLKKMHERAAEVLNKRSETDTLKNLRHPYIPQVLDFIELDDGIYTVMDYVPGTSFKQLLDSGRKFSQKEALKYARQLFEVLAYIHSRKPKVIHGDIKPDNLMLTPEDNICLIDFNISGIAGKNGAVIDGYTKYYSSPEQIANFKKNINEKRKIVSTKDEATIYDETQYDKTELITDGDDKTELISAADDRTELITDRYEKTEIVDETEFVPTDERSSVDRITGSFAGVDERADIYSAAATIYHILTGQKPELVNNKVAPVKMICPNVTDAFSYVLEHAMEADPKKRFQSSADVLKALNELHKLDKRYKSLVRQQNTLFVVAIMMICVGVALFVKGQNLKKIERVDKYSSNVDQMMEISVLLQNGETGHDDQFEALYNECISLNSKQVDAYLSKAIYLYNKKEYTDVIDYLDREVIDDVELTNQSGGETFFYLYGSSYLKLASPDCDMAITAFKKSIDKGYEQPSCYRELAEAYLAKGDLVSAENVLAEAKAKNVSGADMDLMTGEIYLAQKNYPEAEKSYHASIATSELSGDYEVLVRAFLGMNDTIRSSYESIQGIETAIGNLDEAMKVLPNTYQIQIIQSQIQNYIDAYQMTEDASYAQEGIGLINDSIDNGWKNYSNYINLAFLYEQCKDYESARKILQDLINEYPDNYVTYKRMAYLEADIQKSVDTSKRDYTLFASYYKEALSKFEQSNITSGDLEMDFLAQMFKEAKDNGWIK